MTMVANELRSTPPSWDEDELMADGWLDFYAGTGDPDYRSLMPNRMFRNAAGQHFEDVTTSGQSGGDVREADFSESSETWYSSEQVFSSAESSTALLPNAFSRIERFGDNASEEVLPDQIAEALRDLDELIAEADEEGIAPPSASAMADAKRILRAIYDIVSAKLNVESLQRKYVMDLFPEGIIAVVVPGGFNRSVMVLCELDGSVLCSVNMNGTHRRQRYIDTDQLLEDGFLSQALRELERE